MLSAVDSSYLLNQCLLTWYRIYYVINAMKENPIIEREPLAVQVTRRLRNSIIAGNYKPGERLTEENMSRKKGVSRNVIREAFHRLEIEGLIVNDFYKGKSVVRLSHKDMLDMLRLRITLECHAVERTIENLTEDDAQMLKGKAIALSKPDISFQEYNLADRELHQAIARCSRNARVEKFVNELLGPFFMERAHREYLNSVSPDLGEFLSKAVIWEAERSVRGHQLIVEKICEKNTREAQEVMRKHLTGWAPKDF